MNKRFKVKFRKIPNGKVFESYGYYADLKDWKSRNNTYTLLSFTNKREPPKLACPECGSNKIGREIIGTEYETVCKECEYYDSKDHFIPKEYKDAE